LERGGEGRRNPIRPRDDDRGGRHEAANDPQAAHKKESPVTTYTWNTGTSGDWGVAGNWTASPSGFPNANNATVTINAAGNYIVTISGGESYTANTVTLNSPGAVLEVDGTLTLAGTSPALTVTLGEFDLFGELVGGTVKLTGGSITLENDSSLNDVTWLGPLTLAYNTNLFVGGGLTVETAAGGAPGLIDMTAGYGRLYVYDSETLDNATLNFGSASQGYLSVYDPSDTGLTLGSGFTVEQSGGDDYLSGFANDTIVNAGKIDVTGGDLLVNVPGFTNSGSITISGGYVDIGTTTFSSSGAILVSNGGTLEIAPATAADITYDDPALVILDNPTTYTGTFAGFSVGDMLQLDGEDVTHAGILGTTLTVELSVGGPLTYKTGPGLSGATFSVSTGSDGYQDLLTVETACFLPGTRIRTTRGDVRVQDLAVGDMVVTLGGRQRPLCWIGRGSAVAVRGQRSAATPLIVRKGALADNVPNRDLRITKGHSLFLDDVLIPVEFLVNHRSILWDDVTQDVEVFHLELDEHDILIANGAAAESYRDDDNRWLFSNASSGGDQPAKPACAPVLTGGPVVDAVWRRLLDRAGGPTRQALTQDAQLALSVDGTLVAPITLHDGMAVFLLGRRPGQVRLVSRSAVPLELGLARDARELGVAVRRVVVRKGSRPCVIEAADVRLTDGFHPFEADEGIRWTNGDADLPTALFAGFTGEFEVAIHLGGATQYLDDGGALRAA
jgi:hypothetical protein